VRHWRTRIVGSQRRPWHAAAAAAAAVERRPIRTRRRARTGPAPRGGRCLHGRGRRLPRQPEARRSDLPSTGGGGDDDAQEGEEDRRGPTKSAAAAVPAAIRKGPALILEAWRRLPPQGGPLPCPEPVVSGLVLYVNRGSQQKRQSGVRPSYAKSTTVLPVRTVYRTVLGLRHSPPTMHRHYPPITYSDGTLPTDDRTNLALPFNEIELAAARLQAQCQLWPRRFVELTVRMPLSHEVRPTSSSLSAPRRRRGSTI
jgi:hypothetical protein